jgi:hypothetical protein
MMTIMTAQYGETSLARQERMLGANLNRNPASSD